MRWERVQQVGLGDSSSVPGKRWGHTCNAIKGGRFLYVFGGFVPNECLTNQVHVFDAETQIWTRPVINGVPPCPRDSHSCTTVRDNLFVFGGTDGTKHLEDLYVLDTSSHTWICPNIRSVRPAAREAHSAALIDKRLFIFGGCGKSSSSDDEVFYNDLYILNTETFEWKRAVTTGKPPSARDSHTCSTWKNKIIVVGGEDLDDNYLSDVHILDTDKFVWKEVKTSGQLLTARAGHVTVALEKNLLVFGGFTDSQYLYNDLYVLNLETSVWSKVVAMDEEPSARFSSTAVSLDPYKAGLFIFFGGCNKNLEPMDDIYYLHTEGGYNVQVDLTPGRWSLRKQMKLKCQQQKLAVTRTNIDQGRENPLKTGLTDHIKPIFQAKFTSSGPLGHTIETVIDGKLFHGVLFPSRHSSVQMGFPSSSNRQGKRPAMSDGNCDRPAKIPRTSSKDSASCSQQANSINPSDDANKKGADSNDMNTPLIGTLAANVNMMRPQETETAVVKDREASSSQQVNPIDPSEGANKKCADSNDMDTPMIDTLTDMVRPQEIETAPAKDQEASCSQQVNPIDPSDDTNKKGADSNDMDTPMIGTLAANVNMVSPQEIEIPAVKDQNDSQLDTGIVSIEPSPVSLARENVEPLRNETSTDAAEAGPGGDSSPQNQDEGTLAAEDAKAEQKPQPQ